MLTEPAFFIPRKIILKNTQILILSSCLRTIHQHPKLKKTMPEKRITITKLHLQLQPTFPPCSGFCPPAFGNTSYHER